MDALTQNPNLQIWFEWLNVMPNPITFNKKTLDEKGEVYDEILFVNQAFIDILGYTAEDIPTDREWFQKAYPDPLYQAYITQAWFNTIEQAHQAQTNLLGFPAKVTCKDQQERWFHITTQLNYPIDDLYHTIVFVEVETPNNTMLALQYSSEQLIARNQQLQKQQAQLQEIQQVARIGNWELDIQTQLITWSDEVFRLYEEDPLTFQPSLEYIINRMPEAEQAQLLHALQIGIKTGERQRLTHTFERQDGSMVVLEIYGQILFDAHGNPIKAVGSTMDISHLVKLQKEHDELANLIHIAHKEISIIDFHSYHYLYANETALKNLGYQADELLDMSIFDIHPTLTFEQVQILKQRAEVQDIVTHQSLHKRNDGSTYHVQASVQKITYKGVDAFAIFDTDITPLISAENKLKNHNALLENIINNVPVRLFWKDLEGVYLGANNLFLKDAKLQSKHDIIGKTDFELTWGQTNAQDYRDDDLAIINSGKAKLMFEESQTNAKGETITLSTSKVPLRNTQGEVIGVLGTYEDITARRTMEDALRQQQITLHHQANHDALTNLPNRVLFQDRLQQSIAKSKRNQKQFALLFIDLDQFKQINDSLGHDIGDKVLQNIAKALTANLREEDTLARLGGDEFTVILEEISHPQDASELAQKIIEITKQPLQVEEHTLCLSSSIGISIYPKDAQTADELLKYADAAMYRAKDEGRDNFQFYTSDMTLMAFEHIALQASLRQAIQNQEFVVYYQPQINAQTQQIIGMEALVRWLHPIMGIIPPNKFIPLAEQTGMIVELDRIVMRIALQQFVSWYQQGFNPGKLALNLSVKQIAQPDFIEFLTDLINTTECKPAWLELEVTESDVMKNPEKSIAILNQIKALGIHIAIDDFGTGYSSLAYLKRLPVNKLKIDQSFIRDLPQDEEDAAITKAVIALAQALDLKVIAEGVETLAQQDFLLANGCPHIQGFFYSRPIPQAKMTLFLQEF